MKNFEETTVRHFWCAGVKHVVEPTRTTLRKIKRSEDLEVNPRRKHYKSTFVNSSENGGGDTITK